MRSSDAAYTPGQTCPECGALVASTSESLLNKVKRLRLWLAGRLVPFYVIDPKGRDLWLSGWKWDDRV